jgi:hypothetical protein
MPTTSQSTDGKQRYRRCIQGAMLAMDRGNHRECARLMKLAHAALAEHEATVSPQTCDAFGVQPTKLSIATQMAKQRRYAAARTVTSGTHSGRAFEGDALRTARAINLATRLGISYEEAIKRI